MSTEPILISTWSFSRRGAEAAWPLLAAGGDALDAAERVCIEAELDPTVDSVGFGGLPDRDGTVTLDGCVMRSPSRCGGVCAIRDHLHAVTLARHVMDGTPHVLLAGPGADAFADERGMPRADLLADGARARWEQWRKDRRPVDHALDASLRPVDDGAGGPLFGHDTVGVLAIDAAGAMAGACSTSGLAFKRPGRVGDSPIIGHGLYVDPEIGGATATGTGEIVMGTCGSFLVVEAMRRGASPAEAVAEGLDRMNRGFELGPRDQVGIIALTPDGRRAAGALRDGFRLVVASADGVALESPGLVLDPEHHVSE